MLGLVLRELIWYLKEMVLLGDLRALLRYYRRGSADIIFFYRAGIDEQWLHSTVLESQERMDCAVVVNRRHATPEQMQTAENYCVSLLAVRLFQCKVFVSTASTISRNLIWPGTKYIVHMPHSLASFHMIYPQGTFDIFNVIFCAGQHHVAEIKAMDRLTGRENRLCFEVGYGKMDLLRAEFEQTTALKKRKNKTILLAPSWGKDNILDTIGRELIETLLSHGYRVIVRPHPIQAKTSRVLFDLVEKYRNVDHFYIEDVTTMHASLYSADLMISDYSGVAYEFAFLRERPVLFLDVPKKIGNSEWEDVGIVPLEIFLRDKVGEIVAGTDLTEILSKTQMLLDTADTFKEDITQERKKYLFNYQSCSSQAAEALVELVLEQVKRMHA